MSRAPELFQHSSNSAWMVLATSEVLRPPHLFDLSLRMAGLIDEDSPVLLVGVSDSDSESLSPLVEQLKDTLATDSLKFMTLDEFSLTQIEGRVGGLILYGGTPRQWVQEANRFQLDDPDPALPLIDLMLLIGAPCAAAGEWVLTSPSPDAVEDGLGWLPHGLVTPGLVHSADLTAVRDLLARESGSFAIGLPADGILALGPSGELEIWSEVNPGILFGKGWSQS